MASISINIDTRRMTNAGTYPLKICISHNYTKAYILTGIKLRGDQWKNGQVTNHPQKQKLNSMLRIRLAELEQRLFILSGNERIKSMSAHRLRDKLILPEGAIDNYALVLDWWDKTIESKNAIGTIKLYQAHKAHLIDYCTQKGINTKELVFEDITADVLREIARYLDAKGLAQNTRADFFTKFAAVFNFAISRKVISKDCYPFAAAIVKRAETRKRSLSVGEINTMLYSGYEIGINENYAQALKLFALSFYLIGINSTDLYNLKGGDISNGRVQYYRAKTGRLYDIKLEPEAMKILNEIGDTKGPRLFPWLNRYKDSNAFASNWNTYIKTTGRRLLGKNISIYWARHSWATIAASLDIPKETISAALGHGTKTVTDVYINFDASKIDKANRAVIDCVISSSPNPQEPQSQP